MRGVVYIRKPLSVVYVGVREGSWSRYFTCQGVHLHGVMEFGSRRRGIADLGLFHSRSDFNF